MTALKGCATDDASTAEISVAEGFSPVVESVKIFRGFSYVWPFKVAFNQA